MDFNTQSNSFNSELPKINVPKNNTKINMFEQDLNTLSAQFPLGKTTTNNEVENIDLDEEVVNSNTTQESASISQGKKELLDEQILNSSSDNTVVSSNNGEKSENVAYQSSEIPTLQKIVMGNFEVNNELKIPRKWDYTYNPVPELADYVMNQTASNQTESTVLESNDESEQIVNNNDDSSNGMSGVQYKKLKPFSEIVLEEFANNHPSNVEPLTPFSEQVLEQFREEHPSNIESMKPFSEIVLEEFANNHSLNQDIINESETVGSEEGVGFENLTVDNQIEDSSTVTSDNNVLSDNVLNESSGLSDDTSVNESANEQISGINSNVQMSQNERFYNFLNGKVSTNKYDAAAGNFIQEGGLKEKYWLDRDLIFDQKDNGTYLISVIDGNGNKVAMGYTDADTYNNYMTGGADGNNGVSDT